MLKPALHQIVKPSWSVASATISRLSRKARLSDEDDMRQLRDSFPNCAAWTSGGINGSKSIYGLCSLKAVAAQAVAAQASTLDTDVMPDIDVAIAAHDLRARLAQNIKRLRASRGLAQERLALDAGVDRTMLSKIERQVTNPSLETLLKISLRLQVDVAVLLEPLDAPSVAPSVAPQEAGPVSETDSTST